MLDWSIQLCQQGQTLPAGMRLFSQNTRSLGEECDYGEDGIWGAKVGGDERRILHQEEVKCRSNSEHAAALRVLRGI